MSNTLKYQIQRNEKMLYAKYTANVKTAKNYAQQIMKFAKNKKLLFGEITESINRYILKFVKTQKNKMRFLTNL